MEKKDRNNKIALRAKSKRLTPQRHDIEEEALDPDEIIPVVDNSKLKSYLPEAFKTKMGRPSLYDPEILPRIEELCLKGLNNKQIAASIGISEKTFYEWKRDFSGFSHSLKKYRGLADVEVENALYKSAVGFNFTESKKERRKTGKNEDGTDKYELVLTEELVKHIPGVSAAQIFYLKNRMPDRYRDKVEVAHGLADDVSGIAFAIKRRGE